MSFIDRFFHFPHSVEKVFSYLDSDERVRLWIPDLEKVEYLDDKADPSKVGTKFRWHLNEGGRVRIYDGDVRAYEKNRLVAFNLTTKGMSMVVSYGVAGDAHSSNLRYTCDMHINGIFNRIMGTLIGKPLSVMILKKMMKRLRHCLDHDITTKEQLAENPY